MTQTPNSRAERVRPDRPQRILFLMDALGGGTGNHLYGMLEHWDSSLWRADIVSQVPRNDRRVTPSAGVAFLPPLRWFDRYPLAQAHRLLQVGKELAAKRPHLLHAYFSWSIIYARILKRLGHFRFLVENREDEGFNWGRDEYALLRLTRSLPDRVICVSEAVRRVALAREGLDPSRTFVIHNGVDPPRPPRASLGETRRELGLGDDALVVGMVANFNRPVKGVKHFFDAMPAIVAACPSARFLLLGRGEQELALRDRARALGVEPYVVFAGYRDDVETYYAVMDVSVLTSLSEGLSITLLESMNHGLPVVATRVGGNPEVVVEGVTGYLVPPEDPSAFASRVVELLGDPARRRAMGSAGRARVDAHFRLGTVASRYLEVYRSLSVGGAAVVPSA